MPLIAFPVSVPVLQWEGWINNIYVRYFTGKTHEVPARNTRTRNGFMTPGDGPFPGPQLPLGCPSRSGGLAPRLQGSAAGRTSQREGELCRPTAQPRELNAREGDNPAASLTGTQPLHTPARHGATARPFPCSFRPPHGSWETAGRPEPRLGRGAGSLG